MRETTARQHAGEQARSRRPQSALRLLPAETRLPAARSEAWLGDPELAGNPVALAHARAIHENRPPSPGAGHPIGTALLFLVVVPAILLLVSNPLGLVALFGLCLGFGYLFGFGGIL
jgi:hypothetical protein